MILRNIARYYHEHKPALIFLIIAFFVYAFLLVHKYLYFAYSDWDMAFFNQSLWNLLHGRLYSELYGLNTWGTHAEFIIDFAAPLLLIFPHPLTFSFVQIFFYILSGWLFYLMAAEDIDKWPALFLTVMYIFFTPNMLAMCHDHNAESLAPFFIMWAVYCFRKGQVGRYYCSLLFLIMVKENMSSVVAMLGVWGMFAKERNRFVWGVLPFALGIIYFIFVCVWFVPTFRGGPLPYGERYAYLGTNSREILLNLFQLKTWIVILSAPWIHQWVLALFSAFLLPALLSPFVLVLMLPIFGYHLLSAFEPETTLLNIYALSMTPIIFLASLHTFKKYRIRGVLLISVFIILFAGCVWQMYQYRQALALKTGYVHDDNNADKWRLVNRIPRDAAVIATFEFLPALSLREGLYSFHKVYFREFQEEAAMRRSLFYAGQRAFRVSDNVTYALINFNDVGLVKAFNDDARYAGDKVERFMRDWEKVDSSGAVKLFRRKTGTRGSGD